MENLNMEASEALAKRKREVTEMKPERRIPHTIGAGLLLMVVLAGLSFPSLGTLQASLGLVGIFILDLVVAFGIWHYHGASNARLAKFSGLMRLAYTAVLGLAIGFHFAGEVALFKSIWGLGLIAFGVHLISLGILFEEEKKRKWLGNLIRALLILAGIGYVIEYVGIWLATHPIDFAAAMDAIFMIPMILGEVFYAFWMLFRGGRAHH